MFLKVYLIALSVFFAMDMLWLGVVAKDFYRVRIGALMNPEVNWIAAVVFYIIFIFGLVIFVIEPALEKSDWTRALFLGALFGFVCYATYDLTNLAVAKNWPLSVTIVDLVWGAVLASTVSTATYLIAKKIGM